jgi:serine/threonine-protein kinase RsbW
MKQNRNDRARQILGRVKRDDFIGRSVELERLVSHGLQSPASKRRDDAIAAPGLLILLAPLSGVSELLRQTFDRLFDQRDEVAPIYFALPQTETTAVSAAIEFLNTFLLQYVAYRRDEPSLCQASLTLNDLVQVAPAGDLDWIEELVESYNRQRFGDDDRALVKFCLSAPRRVPANLPRPFILFDAVNIAHYADSPVPLATEIVRALGSGGSPFVLAGLRREILNAVEQAGGNTSAPDLIRLEPLAEEDARQLITAEARRQQVSLNDEARDLLVQQLEGSPYFITAMLQAAREKHLALDSYRACERLYVDELMGGRLQRQFASVLEHVAPEPETRASVVRLLCEAVPSGKRTASLETWRKRLNLTSFEVERVLRALHTQELINWDGETVDAESGSNVWKDYLRSRFRLDALREPRALVVADVMAAALKRAPQTISRHYRRAANLRLSELLGEFNAQLVPRILFDSAQFADLYKGLAPEDVAAAMDADTNLLRLPQVFQAASGVSFSVKLKEFGEEASVVAHAFEGGSYTDANEIVWLAAKVDSKLEADRSLAERYCDLLDSLARQSGFLRTRIWLIANEGFSAEACEFLSERNAFGSSQQQFELLATRLGEPGAGLTGSSATDEFELILPMGGDNELLAATTVEQVARRLNFSPEAINQIKTAVVEACINASEHSLSPDRKIYQRFRVEDDKLVITIASRGILPINIAAGNQAEPEQIRQDESGDEAEQRRGWGLKLIKTLMDEVEFERVDEGTSLRMTKYVRRRS